MLGASGAALAAAAAARAFSTSAAVQAAAPAVASASQRGFLSKLWGSGSRVDVPLTDALPGVVVPDAVSPSAEAPSTRLTKLKNGMTIATENTPGATATLGIYVDSGSVHESPANTGVSHLLEYMAFKTTKNRTHLRLVREVEAIGGNVLASASREQMAYNIDTSKATVPEALEVLADAVLNPKFQSWEVAEQVRKMEADVKNLKDNPQTTLLEGLHSVAYSGGLGRPLIVPEGMLGGLTADVAAEFYAANYTAPRMVLAGAGVDHDELVRLAEPLLAAAPSAGASGESNSAYVGGDWRQFSASPLTHAILAFEYQGGWRDVKGSVAMTVLQYLLGGGGSFSAGGPGKGMHSRLYTRVLNAHPWMHNCTALNSIYNSTGLVGIFASAESSQAGEMVDVLCKEIQAVAKGVTDVELERAKSAAVSSVLMNLESRAVVAEDIGRQVLTYGHRKPVAEFIGEIRGLKASHLSSAVNKLLKTAPSMAVLGDIAHVPRYDQVMKRFG
ncbi:mitochondrial-processing peptidase subunit alpha-like [Micractinium conductrix]|uniref:Mitochondrial-processing peptidase subunit alpha-like n=1 Tax=Micractinium conductrix TaxID=554055 RepID=A0A2P6VB24_9CHLO|nr:mitochondrial-processing peptidase subunit alpha-like [Micractinium conductrix]|eukprot:PSC71302.1 mitochondrial-processing peptidase subunit alpha-like [Micractinium conductrix]